MVSVLFYFFDPLVPSLLSLQVLFVLFEHASGYAIFRCEDVEDIGGFLPEVQEAVLDFARFGSMLTLEAFSPFKSGVNALENINCISEGAQNVPFCVCGMTSKLWFSL